MGTVEDFLSLIAGCIAVFFSKDRVGLYITLAIGVLLAALCWWACSTFSKLWNTRYHVKLRHHTLCAIAAIVTLAASIIFGAMKYTKEAATVSIQLWEAQVLLDGEWSNLMFARSYDAVYNLRDSDGGRLEDFEGFPPPHEGGRLIPTNHEESYLATSSTYANGAISHFRRNRPFLSKILWESSRISEDTILSSMSQFFENNPGGTYELNNAVKLAGEETRKHLKLQAPRVVPIARTILIGVFLLIQAIPFGMVARGAYVDLKAWKSAV